MTYLFLDDDDDSEEDDDDDDDDDDDEDTDGDGLVDDVDPDDDNDGILDDGKYSQVSIISTILTNITGLSFEIEIEIMKHRLWSLNL